MLIKIIVWLIITLILSFIIKYIMVETDTEKEVIESLGLYEFYGIEEFSLFGYFFFISIFEFGFLLSVVMCCWMIGII